MIMIISRVVTSRVVHLLVIAALILAAPVAAMAQDTYPSRPIRIVVPFPPGGTVDTLSRVIGEKLTLKWGQPVIIESRPGASGNIGAEAVARSEPDGYMLLATAQALFVIAPTFYTKLPFDPAAFVPVTVMAHLPYVLVVHPNAPYSSLPELIAFAKANPDKLNYASPGTGSSNQLAMEWVKLLGHVNIAHVPYKGSAPAVTDLMAGHVDVMLDNLANSYPLIKGGKLKVIAVGNKTRIPEFPDVPTMAETFPALVATSWFAMVAPPKTPSDIVSKLSQAVTEAIRAPETAARFKQLGATAAGGSPEATAAFFKEETERWRKVIVTAGIRPE